MSSSFKRSADVLREEEEDVTRKVRRYVESVGATLWDFLSGSTSQRQQRQNENNSPTSNYGANGFGGASLGDHVGGRNFFSGRNRGGASSSSRGGGKGSLFREDIQSFSGVSERPTLYQPQSEGLLARIRKFWEEEEDPLPVFPKRRRRNLEGDFVSSGRLLPPEHGYYEHEDDVYARPPEPIWVTYRPTEPLLNRREDYLHAGGEPPIRAIENGHYYTRAYMMGPPRLSRGSRSSNGSRRSGENKQQHVVIKSNSKNRPGGAHRGRLSPSIDESGSVPHHATGMQHGRPNYANYKRSASASPTNRHQHANPRNGTSAGPNADGVSSKTTTTINAPSNNKPVVTFAARKAGRFGRLLEDHIQVDVLAGSGAANHDTSTSNAFSADDHMLLKTREQQLRAAYGEPVAVGEKRHSMLPPRRPSGGWKRPNAGLSNAGLKAEGAAEKNTSRKFEGTGAAGSAASGGAADSIFGVGNSGGTTSTSKQDAAKEQDKATTSIFSVSTDKKAEEKKTSIFNEGSIFDAAAANKNIVKDDKPKAPPTFSSAAGSGFSLDNTKPSGGNPFLKQIQAGSKSEPKKAEGVAAEAKSSGSIFGGTSASAAAT
ncbi:unnamed protein product, partial [Amoebophrya sp. A25]|eukprot:GSA25T00001361001.1